MRTKVPSDDDALRQPLSTKVRSPIAMSRTLFQFSAGFLLVLGGLIALALWQLRAQAIESGERLTASFAHVIEEQTTRTFQAVDQRLLLAADSLTGLETAGLLNEASTGEMLRQQVQDLPFIRVMVIVDPQGRMKYASDPRPVGLNVADRAYFQIYQTQPKTALYIDAPIRAQVTGKWTINVTRPWHSANGTLAGVIVAAVDPAFFEKLWSGIDLGAGSSIALFRRDGVLMMRYPLDDAIMGKNFKDRPLFRELLPKNSWGSFQNVSPIDGVARIFAYRTLSAQPNLVVAVGQANELELAPWRKQAWLAFAIWAVAGVATSLLCLFLGRAWQQRAKEEALAQEMAERFTLATDAASIGVWDWNIKANQAYGSPTYFTMLGYAHDSGAFTREQALELIHPDDRAAITDQILKKLDGEKTPFEYEARIRHANGTYRWIRSVGRVIGWDENNKPNRLMGVRGDVTDRKEAQEGVKKSEQHLRNLIDGLGPAMLVGLATADGILIEVNQPALAAAGLKPQDVMGKPLEDTFWVSYSEETRQQIRDAVIRGRQGESSRFEMKIRGLDGQFIMIDFSLQPVRDEAGQITFLVPSASVITERKLAESALKESEERYRLLIDQSPFGIGVHQNGKVVLANPAALAMFGATRPADLIGQFILDLVHPDNREEARAKIGRMLRGETGLYPAEYRFLRLVGNAFDVEVTAMPFAFEGQPAVQIIMVDVTQRKQTEASLREHRAQLKKISRRVLEVQEAERRRVAVELHDELGQALTAIKINLHHRERLRGEPSNDLNVENLRIVEDALQQVRRLALALRPSMLDDLGLVPALRWLAEQASENDGFVTNFRSTLAKGRLPPEVETTFFRIAQAALVNCVRHAQAHNVEIDLSQENGRLILVIRDDGCGFDLPAMRERAMAGGSIGLLGMQERATLISGQLDIESAPGQGTTLRLHCPLNMEGEAA